MKNAFTAIAALLIILSAASTLAASPDSQVFPIRAFHLDLRIQRMTMPALETFATRLHQGGINALIVEYEATYPFDKNPLIPNQYAYTRAQIVSFVALCNRLGIDLIPLQQSFGHVEYILRNERYRQLREDPKDLSQVCPLETLKDSLLFTALFTELASTHTSPYIHIGCDETHLLGHCAKCRRKAEKEGISKLYIDYVSMLCHIVIGLGKTPILWADIALKYPEAIKSLPKGTIFVDWNYGWDMNRFGDHQKLINSGFEIWGAPAMRSSPDNYYLTQWEKHFDNIRDFVPQARRMGYKGIVLTSWSTSGVYSYLYDSENGLVDLFPVRHVYPITGFNILLAAYMAAIDSTASLDIPGFIRSYCADVYGFSATQAMDFWSALTTAPYEVDGNNVQSPKPISLTALADSSARASATLHALDPSKNKPEFEHYRLMADIRSQYLQFQVIEQAVNAPTFTREQIAPVLKRLDDLIALTPSLDQRFIDLNKDAFHLSELQQENRLRMSKMLAIYDQLKN